MSTASQVRDPAVLDRRAMASAVLALMLALVWVMQVQAETATEKPATIAVDAAGMKVLTFTPRAAERIGIETVAVVTDVSGGSVIPTAAVLYLPDGSTWTYVAGMSLTFHRQQIDIADITSAGVILKHALPKGTLVVVSGVPEFWGLESGIGG